MVLTDAAGPSGTAHCSPSRPPARRRPARPITDPAARGSPGL